jgi:serine/threonine protein phosphatase PrpC
MEDTFFISEEGRFCAVFDGHGGAEVAKYLKSNMFARFQSCLPEGQWTDEMIKSALHNSLRQLDDEVLGVAHWRFQGSTAICLYVNDSDEGGSIFTANIGDSRAVLSRKNIAIDLTQVCTACVISAAMAQPRVCRTTNRIYKLSEPV